MYRGQDDRVEAGDVEEPVAAGEGVAHHLVEVVVGRALGREDPGEEGAVGVHDAEGVALGGRGEGQVGGVLVPDQVDRLGGGLAVVGEEVPKGKRWVGVS